MCFSRGSSFSFFFMVVASCQVLYVLYLWTVSIILFSTVRGRWYVPVSSLSLINSRSSSCIIESYPM